MDALEQIMAEQDILGHAAGQAVLEGVDIVDAFANVAAAAKEILVDVGHGVGVEVQPNIACEDPAKA